MAIDILHDPFLKVANALQQHVSFPEYVLRKELDEKPSSPAFYAWPEKLACPLGTPADCYLSIAYQLVADEKDSIPEQAQQRLLKYACAHGIERDVADLVESLSNKREEEKKAECLLDVNYNGEKVQAFPVNDSSSCSEAQACFLESQNRLLPQWREKVAQNLVRLGTQYAVPIHPTVLSYARVYVCHPEVLQEELQKRANRAYTSKQVELSRTLDTLTEAFAIGRGTCADTAVLEKVAETLQVADEILGIADVYGRGLRSPMEAVYNTPLQKIAEDYNNAVELSSGAYTVASILQHIEGLNDLLGGELAAAANEDPAQVKYMLETLPRDLKFLVEDYLKGQGVTPLESL